MDNLLIKKNINGMFHNILLDSVGIHLLTCVPINDAGVGENRSVSMNVTEKLPTISITPLRATVNEGSVVVFTCLAIGFQSFKNFWKKDGVFKGDGSSLMLSSVGRDDSGNYTCNVTSTCGTTMKTASLDVIYKPENTTLVSNSTLGCVGDIVLLSCSADGKPSDVTHSLASDGEHLHASEAGIFLVTLERPGWNNFTCIPSNTAGKGEEADISIFASVPPLVAKFPSSEVTIMEGHPAKLMCNVTGSPVPNATWYKLGFERWYHSGPMLVLSKKNDAGSYRCIATNEAVCKNTSTSDWINVTFKSVKIEGQDSAIVGLAVVVAILVLVIIGLIAYVMWLKRAGKKSKRDRTLEHADNTGFSPEQIPMQGTSFNYQAQDKAMEYQVAQDVMRDNIPNYEDVTQGENFTQHASEDTAPCGHHSVANEQCATVTQGDNITQYGAMGGFPSRDLDILANQQNNAIVGTTSKVATNNACHKGEASYENIRKRGLPPTVYQSLQTIKQQSENAQYASLNLGTRIATMPGDRDEGEWVH
ncbi:hemicentin-2 [Nematostella vectensis]|uniref:hemicentin-2 n=1 Tax=Nematostella vectensis TaxID=45351 RepID=UPI0020777AB7|nr:hemicentin-2 [Nematostella vectensis]